MKQLTFLNLILLFSLMIPCSAQLITTSEGKQIDERLVGTWEGSEKDNQMEGMTKQWTMTRNEDGTFSLDFSMTMDGETQTTQETGTWWIENWKFYEYHDYSDKTDIYEYEILNKKKVKFKSEVLAMDMNTESYEFIDHKIKDNKSKKKGKQDGLSLETAITVKSIEEEYEFARTNCQDCELLGQALSEYKNKPIDILTLKKADGEEISYYFDISSFFGKF